MDYLTDDDFREFLRLVVENTGGMTEFCRVTNLDRSMVYKTLRGELPPQPILLERLTASGEKIEEIRLYGLPEGWVKWRAAPHSLRK